MNNPLKRQGGTYIKDPKTGELTLVAQTKQNEEVKAKSAKKMAGKSAKGAK